MSFQWSVCIGQLAVNAVVVVLPGSGGVLDKWMAGCVLGKFFRQDDDAGM